MTGDSDTCSRGFGRRCSGSFPFTSGDDRMILLKAREDFLEAVVVFEDFIKDYENAPEYKTPLNLDSVLIFKIIPRARNNC